MKKKLYLHIGSHKTGTSSIQASCFENTVYLNEQNFNYFSQSPEGKTIKSGNTSNWIPGDVTNHLHILSGYGLKILDVRKLAHQLHSLPHDNIIMSAENFSWIFDKKQILDLYESLKNNFIVKIIIYIRRQDKLAISHFQQASKSRNGPAYAYYKGGNQGLPISHDGNYKYLDFNKKITMWANIFGKDNILIKVFEKNNLTEQDVVKDFFKTIDVEYCHFKTFSINHSNGFEKTKIGHLLNESKLNEFMSTCIRNNAENLGKSLPSREVAEEFYDNYRHTNIELNEKFKISSEFIDIFDSDFSDYPEKREDIWTDESANKAILNIFHSLEIFNCLDADTLRDAALSLEKINADLAFKLMLMAHNLRPTGLFIKRKLEEYTKNLSSM